MSKRRLFTRAPATPIEHLAAEVREYLHMPDPGALYSLVGAVAANMMQGEPVWLMLIGPPGSGKTELLNSLLTIPGMHELASLSNLAAFLSATPKKEKSKDADGGLLRRVGKHGGAILNDFTSVLSIKPDTLKEILGVFRETYSGRWTRSVGAEGGLSLRWEGKVAYLAGCTSEIDRHQAVNAALGERWVYYRYPEDDAFEKTRRALINSRLPNWRKNLAEHMRAFFDDQGLKFGEVPVPRSLEDYEIHTLIQLGQVAARSRSSIPRDQRTKEVTEPKETEVGTRVSTVLGQLYLGMERVGVPESERWTLVRKIALDSMPRLRRLIVESAFESEGVTLDLLFHKSGCSRAVIKRAVEDLQQHQVLLLDAEGTVTLQPDIIKGLRQPRRHA